MEGIGLASTIFDLDGARYIRGEDLDPGTEITNRSRARRVARTATLDGGISVYDTGYAASDRILTIRVMNPTADISAFFAYLVETYNTIVVTTAESAYEGTPLRSYHADTGAVILEIGINEEIA